MDSSLQDLADKAIRYAIDSGAQYCDARAEQQERKSALIENGEIEHGEGHVVIGHAVELKWNRARRCLRTNNGSESGVATRLKSEWREKIDLALELRDAFLEGRNTRLHVEQTLVNDSFWRLAAKAGSGDAKPSCNDKGNGNGDLPLK